MEDISPDSNSLRREQLKRRKFLKFCAISTLPTWLAACGTSATGTGLPGVTATATRQASPTTAATPPAATDADWSAFAGKLRGTLVRPGNPQYATAHQLFSERFDNIQPAGVAYCASPADVQASLAFAQKFALPFAVRCGGHSYAGYSTSTGLVLDVTKMNTVIVDANSGNATIGAGTRLIDVYAALAEQGRVIPAGSCPTVGVAGLTMGGGVGVLGRKLGLTCDNLLSAQVVLADGRILTCDASHDPELFWALRGGGGGNFAVATSFTFRTHQISSLATFTIRWPWSSAADVVDAWQNWAPQAPDEVWSNCLLLAPKDKSGAIVQVNGVYIGSAAQLEPLLQQLTRKITVAPVSRYVSDSGLLETMQIEGGCYGKSVAQCHLPSQNPLGQLQRDTSGVKSDYFTDLLPRQGINNLVDAIARRQDDPTLGEGGIGMDAYGGVINRVAADATAFVHRNALFSAQYSASWNANDSEAIVSANHSWQNATWQAMRQYASGASYQNYVDPDLPNWQDAYYGTNLSRLQTIKAKYDPDNLFRFGQSISPRK
jgi:FAD/FMN-containing dehydrogenase